MKDGATYPMNTALAILLSGAPRRWQDQPLHGVP
jgi:hypothetical protein